MSDIGRIWHFWFAPEHQPKWFERDPAFDAAIGERFAALVESALAGALDHWAVTAHGALALLILLDQFPRNLFRNHARAFAGDPLALAVAHTAIDRGFDQALGPEPRRFFYMPFMHAEDLAAQQRCCALFAGDPDTLKFAEAHRAVIARFSRFPHRNAALGRTSTPEETAFLAGPNSSF